MAAPKLSASALADEYSSTKSSVDSSTAKYTQPSGMGMMSVNSSLSTMRSSFVGDPSGGMPAARADEKFSSSSASSAGPGSSQAAGYIQDDNTNEDIMAFYAARNVLLQNRK